jgi:hypothetical protein
MSELRFAPYVMPAADLGSCNPLPALRRTGDVHATLASDPSIPEDERRHLGYGCGPRVLPYLLQDEYDRNRSTDGEILMARFTEADVLAGDCVHPRSRLRMTISRPGRQRCEGGLLMNIPAKP